MTSPPLPFQIERKKEKFLFFSPLGFCNTFLLLHIFSPLSLSRLRLENRYYRHKKHNITDISQTRKEEKKILKRNPFIYRTRMEMWRYFLRGKKEGGEAWWCRKMLLLFAAAVSRIVGERNVCGKKGFIVCLPRPILLRLPLSSKAAKQPRHEGKTTYFTEKKAPN